MADVLNPNSTEEKLAQFLRRAAAEPIRWGYHDCGLWLADWAQAWLGMDDPAAHLRGRYSNELECEDVISPVPYPLVVSRLARSRGWRLTKEPHIGAIGIVAFPQGDIVGAIRTAAGWAVLLHNRGFGRTVDGTVRVLGAWEPPWSA